MPRHPSETFQSAAGRGHRRRHVVPSAEGVGLVAQAMFMLCRNAHGFAFAFRMFFAMLRPTCALVASSVFDLAASMTPHQSAKQTGSPCRGAACGSVDPHVNHAGREVWDSEAAPMVQGRVNSIAWDDVRSCEEMLEELRQLRVSARAPMLHDGADR